MSVVLEMDSAAFDGWSPGAEIESQWNIAGYSSQCQEKRGDRFRAIPGSGAQMARGVGNGFFEKFRHRPSLSRSLGNLSLPA